MNDVIETDYLVVGAGAAGMTFTDALLAHSDADITVVDRRHTPGGHWLDAYPFVRLHQPSAFYGVSSVPLGSDALDPALRDDFAGAADDTARTRVVIDQIASLTDASAVSRHADLVLRLGHPR